MIVLYEVGNQYMRVEEGVDIEMEKRTQGIEGEGEV